MSAQTPTAAELRDNRGLKGLARSANGRGRDEDYSSPPAHIPACAAKGETSQVPHKELLHVRKVSHCARFFPCKPLRHGRCCLLVSELVARFSQIEGDRCLSWMRQSLVGKHR